jgi:hypothetical protein
MRHGRQSSDFQQDTSGLHSLLAITNNPLAFRQQPESGSESIFFFNEQSSQGDSLYRIGFIV